MLAHCATIQVTPIDLGIVGFVFGVAFASAFFSAIFVCYCRNRGSYAIRFGQTIIEQDGR